MNEEVMGCYDDKTEAERWGLTKQTDISVKSPVIPPDMQNVFMSKERLMSEACIRLLQQPYIMSI